MTNYEEYFAEGVSTLYTIFKESDGMVTTYCIFSMVFKWFSSFAGAKPFWRKPGWFRYAPKSILFSQTKPNRLTKNTDWRKPTNYSNAYSYLAYHETRCSDLPATIEGSWPRSPFIPQQVAHKALQFSFIGIIGDMCCLTNISTGSSETVPGAEHALELSMKQPKIQLNGRKRSSCAKSEWDFCFCIDCPSQKINEVFQPADHS